MTSDVHDSPTLPVRPRLAEGSAVHAPRADGDPWVLERDGRHYFRVSEDLARCARLLTGEYDQAELLTMLGPRWDQDALHRALTQFQAKELLDDGQRRSFARRRLVVVPPISVQLNVIDPSRLLSLIRPLTTTLSTRPAQVGCWLLALSGLVSLVLSVGRVQDVLSNPLPMQSVVLVGIGGFLGTIIHELAHGATLSHYGGRPRRMGFMLFYLLPAFFCDVSDGWLLSDRMHRVRVALAGIFAQFVVAGTAGTAGAVLGDSTFGDGLLLLALGTYLAAVINLIPFVKLDGYLALMAYLDIPHLRDRAMQDARSFLGHVLYGAPRERRLSQRWAVPYGLVCMAFPLYLIGGVALTLWGGMVLGMGLLGAALVLSLVFGLLFAALSGAGRIIVTARRSGASLPRVVGVTTVLAGVVAAVLALVPIQQEVAGYYRVDDGTAQLLIPTNQDVSEIEAGSPVELRSNGVVLRTRVGEGEVADNAAPTEITLDLGEISPVLIDTGSRLDFHAYRIDLVETPDLTTGVAQVDIGQSSLGEWFYDRHVAPSLNW